MTRRCSRRPLMGAILGPATILLAAACGSSSTSPSSPHIDGTTAAWYNGGTVTLAYTKEFACPTPPAAHSVSQCEAGAPATTSPMAGTPLDSIPPIYVLVPLYQNPPQSTTSTLQCPNVGNCVDHPHDLDLGTYLGAVFGPGDTTAALPPHSHVITTLDGGVNEPWLVSVVGVLDSTTWNAIVSAKDSAEITALQQSDPTLNGAGSGGVGTHITTYIPTNLFLFFEAKAN
jgi:hypothetical protein